MALVITGAGDDGRDEPDGDGGKGERAAGDASSEKTGPLLDRAKNGDQGAWRVLLERYRTMLLVEIQSRIPGFARRAFEAEDVLQAALTRAWSQIEKFDYESEGSFRRWLTTLVFNEFRNQLKSHKRRGHHVATESQVGDLEQHEDAHAKSGAADALSRAEMLEALGKLSDEDREIIGMRVFEELGFEQIGSILGCGRERAKQLFVRAMERLERLVD